MALCSEQFACSSSGLHFRTRITYDNRPDVSRKALATATVTNDENQWWEFDVTAWLRNQKDAGRTIVTLALRNLDPSSVFTILHSRNATENVPLLVVGV